LEINDLKPRAGTTRGAVRHFGMSTVPGGESALLFETPSCGPTRFPPMPRALHSAEAIQAEVSRLIHEHRDVRASGAAIGVPLPTAQRADGTGLNWWMSGFGNGFGFQEVIGAAVSNVGKRWNLGDE